MRRRKSTWDSSGFFTHCTDRKTIRRIGLKGRTTWRSVAVSRKCTGGCEMLAQTTTCGYTGSLSKIKAVIPPRQSAAFFMPACRQLYPSLVGVENSHTTPARGKLYAASLMPRVRPTARIKAASLNFHGGQSWLINLSLRP